MPRVVLHIEPTEPVRWKAHVEDRLWVAGCDAIGLTVRASSLGDLVTDIADTHEGHIADLVRTGDIVAFVRDRGWRVSGKEVGLPGEGIQAVLPYVLVMEPVGEA